MCRLFIGYISFSQQGICKLFCSAYVHTGTWCSALYLLVFCISLCSTLSSVHDEKPYKGKHIEIQERWYWAKLNHMKIIFHHSVSLHFIPWCLTRLVRPNIRVGIIGKHISKVDIYKLNKWLDKGFSE